MHAYLDLVHDTLADGAFRPNRTAAGTISTPSYHYRVDVSSDSFPLLTTKDMYWDSLVHELLWFLDGDAHIRDFREKSGIWDEWATEDGELATAYGRFWRRYPIPDDPQHLPGEWWAADGTQSHRPDTTGQPHWVATAADEYDTSPDAIMDRLDDWVTTEPAPADDRLTRLANRVLPWRTPQTRQTFDQLQYIIDALNGDNPLRSKYSRRLVLTAWHPANAAVSKLPPCHYTAVFNLHGDTLNLHLTQRSGDIALGVPFNIASYSLLLQMVAQHTGYDVGEFSHTIVDSHIYCGSGARNDWYAENLPALQEQLATVETAADYHEVRDWLTDQLPAEPAGTEGTDHVPNLLTQLARTPKPQPTVEVADKPIDDITFDDITLSDYTAHDKLSFTVLE